MHGAIYVQDSGNEKLMGSKKIDATYTSIKATCSPTCPLKQDGTCYAMNSFVGMHVNRLDKRARQHSPLKLARAEAQCIDEAYHGGKVPDGRDLRIHVSGDSRSIKGTRVLAKAVDRWLGRGGQSAFSYTHSWAHVPRATWGQTSVLASIESVDQVAAVRDQGYAPALVVAEHYTDKVYTIPGSSVQWIPCPAQTRNVHCADCRLCMRSDWLLESNHGITFAAHGIRTQKLKRHLKMIT